MQAEKKYYNPCKLALSGREYKVLRSYKDGRKKIQFDDFFGEIVIAYPDELDCTDGRSPGWKILCEGSENSPWLCAGQRAEIC